jgi:hypothetical protein
LRGTKFTAALGKEIKKKGRGQKAEGRRKSRKGKTSAFCPLPSAFLTG